MQNELFRAARAVRGVQDEVLELEKICRGAAESIGAAAAAEDPNALKTASLRVRVALKQADRVLGDIEALEKQAAAQEEGKDGPAAFPNREYTGAAFGQMKASVSAWRKELTGLEEAASLAGRAADGARQLDMADALEKARGFSDVLVRWRREAESK